MNATATEVKNRFGEFMEKAQREPVIVEKNGRSSVVIIGFEDFERLRALEDAYWAERATRALAGGLAGRGEVDELLKNL